MKEDKPDILENSKLNNEIDLVEIFSSLWKKRVTVISISLLSTVLSLAYAFYLPDIYISSAKLIPSKIDNNNNNDNSTFSGLSSLAGIAGISLSSEGEKTEEAIARINSFEFFKNFFLPNIKTENLLAVNRWDPKTNQITYKKNIFNKSRNEWVANSKFFKRNKLSEQESFEEFQEILFIEKPNDSSFVDISIMHQSPFIAEKWLNLIIEKINLSMSSIAKKNAETYIDFLNESYRETNSNFVRNRISELIKSQMQILMLSSSNQNYVFEVLEPPFAAEDHFKPNRIIIVSLGFLFGLIVSIFVVLINKSYIGKN